VIYSGDLYALESVFSRCLDHSPSYTYGAFLLRSVFL